MKKSNLYQLLILLLGLITAFGLMSAGCASSGDDDDDNPPAGNDDDDDAADDDDDDDNDDDEGTTVTFSGKVIAFGAATETPIGGIEVVLMDNATGEELAGVSSETTDDNGNVSFSLPKPDPCLVGIWVKGDNTSTHDTFQWNLDCDAGGETLWSVPQYLWVAGPGMAGLTQEAGNGVIAGGLYWVNDGGQEEAVGCATISSSTGGDDGYMDGTGMPAAAQTHTHPSVGYFLIGNIGPSDTEKVEITATVDGTDIGTAQVWVRPDVICISNIYSDDAITANPTPTGCTE